MYIAIVDDETRDREEAYTFLQYYLNSRFPHLNGQFHYETFTSAESFLQQFTPHRYAIVIMDIYMHEMNGMEAAEQLTARDPACKIVFLTTSMEHVLEGYMVHAAGYIVKPLAEHLPQFRQTIDYCLEQLHLEQASLPVTIENTAVAVPLADIYYLDCQNSRTVVLHLAQKTIKTSNTYQECLEYLQRYHEFLECYHRLMINMKKIDVMQEDTFLLKNGESIPISRRKKNEVKQAYLAYLTEH